MATVQEHYQNVLSDVYVWMFGGFDACIERNECFFKAHGITPRGSGVAVDLGAGCGFQSIPLARSGFGVTAIDIDSRLLDELGRHSDGLPITSVRGNLVDFTEHVDSRPELVVCMTDTLLHLESTAMVEALFRDVFTSLEKSGRFVITFRDLSFELSELERFIPVKGDDQTIFTCFLEYEESTVKVHDLVYRNENGEWKLKKSFYRKLRLSKEWVEQHLADAGFADISASEENGLVTIIATK